MTVDIARLRALLAAATPGEWTDAGAVDHEDDLDVTAILSPDPSKPVVSTIWYDGPHLIVHQTDRALICAAVNALPQLLAIAEAALGVDDAIVVWHACGTPEGKQRLLDALLALGAAIDAARKERT